jgi:hypothetical protein
VRKSGLCSFCTYKTKVSEYFSAMRVELCSITPYMEGVRIYFVQEIFLGSFCHTKSTLFYGDFVPVTSWWGCVTVSSVQKAFVNNKKLENTLSV